MKRFRFRLERVLQLKRRLEKQKQQELAQQVQIELNLVARGERLAGQMVLYYTRLRDLQGRAFQPATAQSFYTQIALLADRRLQTRLQLARQRKAVAAKRAELVAASRERRLLESVRERRWQEYQRVLKREEETFLDEMATTRYLWRQREGQRDG